MRAIHVRKTTYPVACDGCVACDMLFHLSVDGFFGSGVATGGHDEFFRPITQPYCQIIIPLELRTALLYVY